MAVSPSCSQAGLQAPWLPLGGGGRRAEKLEELAGGQKEVEEVTGPHRALRQSPVDGWTGASRGPEPGLRPEAPVKVTLLIPAGSSAELGAGAERGPHANPGSLSARSGGGGRGRASRREAWAGILTLSFLFLATWKHLGGDTAKPQPCACSHELVVRCEATLSGSESSWVWVV